MRARRTLIALVLVTAVVPAVAGPAQAQVTSTVRLRVESARTGEPVTSYKFVVTKDDTGDPTQARAAGCMPGNGSDPATSYPSTCDWPSTHTFTGGSGGADNLITQGTQAELSETEGLQLPDGKYLISVVADGFKIDGGWVSVPAPDPGLVKVGLQPDPLPLAQVKAVVFEDNATNGQFDPGIERGLEGWVGHIADVLGEVSTDWYGNPLCTEYDAAHHPIEGTGGECKSNAQGELVIPNLGSNRYSLSVVPPDGQTWIQTTSLEGGHDWDIWAEEGHKGFDPELIVNGAPIPESQFGYVKPTQLDAAHSGNATIAGRVVSVKSYLPPAGGDTFEGPVSRPWISVTDLLDNDTLVYAAQGNADGTFTVPGLKPGDYQVAYWDYDQNLLLQLTNVQVADGQTANVGDLALSHWFSEVHGSVFFDTNKNGRRDAGESGLQGQPVVLKSRDNAVVDAGSKSATTNAQGNWTLKQVYPYGYWTILEVYNDRFYTTGVTYQTDNQPAATTVLGSGVDVATLNQDGLNTRIDIGVQPYARGTNGGIVGTVVYNETRNELDPRLAATEVYEPGIPDLTVNLYQPVTGPDGEYVIGADGSYQLGRQLGTYTSETFERPTDCQARDAGGTPVNLLFAAPATGGHACVESPLMGNQVQTGFAAVNGNYGFTTVWQYDAAGNLIRDAGGDPVEAPMPKGDYLVKVEVPDDAWGRSKYNLTREEDVNVFDGDDYEPQIPPPPCAGKLHTVDVAGLGTDGPDATQNPTFADAGGSPYEGEQRPLCDVKLVTVSDMRSTAPGFHFFTDVPQPGRLFGAVVEDLALGTDPKEFYYGEKAGIPNAPIGIYDFTGRLVHTINADPNGFFEVLLPSTRTFNCPLPAGPCPNVFRLVGNDPGVPGHPNPNYNPAYRTMASQWQIWPGVTLLADVALLPTAPVVEFPGTQTTHPPRCLLPDATPELFAVSTPYVNGSGSFTINGQGFGATAGQVLLDGTQISVTSWGERTIAASVPAGAPPGPHRLRIVRSDGREARNTLTFHVRGGTYTPSVIEVGPGRAHTKIQQGLEAAAAATQALLVVYPNTPSQFAPLGDYFEDVVVHSPVKLQGVGPGGVRPDGSSVAGSIINGLGFTSTNAVQWSTLVEGIKASPGWSGNQQISEGQVVYVVARDGQFTSGYKASIDGFTIQGGDELGLEGTWQTPFYPVQGGGIYVNGYARNLQITNNVIRSNGGAYGGAVRLGTPGIGSNHNDGVRIGYNRILHNGGSNLAGGVALFNGADGYEIDHNEICGNFSAEYGGGISHYGLSGATGPANSIHHNLIWANASYDEGGGIMLAGEAPPAVPVPPVSPGSGPVNVYANTIQSNLAEDDGGGLRLLQAGNWPVNVYDDVIANNVSAHEGGGIALHDATGVRVYNTTVTKNISTSTAATSDGNPVPAGLSTGANSVQLQGTLPPGAPAFSEPLLFNDIVHDNRSGTWDGAVAKLTGLGLPGDTTPVNVWDLGAADLSGKLSPTNTLLTKDHAAYVNAEPSNVVGQDPKVRQPYDTIVNPLVWRGAPQFVQSVIVSLDQPAQVAGDYHLQPRVNGSPALDAGTTGKAGVVAPAFDIDDQPRPVGLYDLGADEDATDAVAPLMTNLAAVPATVPVGITVVVGALVSDAVTGNTKIVAAEWFTGADPGRGRGTAMKAVDGSYNTATELITGTVATKGWPKGARTLYARAKDANGNWTAVKTTTITIR
ncbi:IPT/TIG domain-containing protein [Nonomuraea insulae]|uniref:alpha-amylase n=1 Tax=Nonomuraea insulae TaxID=1616787 RepID=A0ABW1CPD7_9ACTN